MTTMQKVMKYVAIAFAVFLIVGIFGGIASVLSGVALVSGSKDAVGKMKTYAVTGTVEELEITLSATRLVIKNGEDFALESNHKYLEIENSDRVLKVKERRNVFGIHATDVKVILTIPADFEFKRVAISTGAGTVKIDTLLADRLSLDLGAGKAYIGSLNASSRSQISGGAGKLTIGGGELANLDFDLGVGEASLNSRLTGNSKIDCGVGKFDLTLQGEPEEYAIVLDKGVGKATLDGAEISDDAAHGEGENSVQIDGGVGEIDIEFERASHAE